MRFVMGKRGVRAGESWGGSLFAPHGPGKQGHLKGMRSEIPSAQFISKHSEYYPGGPPRKGPSRGTSVKTSIRTSRWTSSKTSVRTSVRISERKSMQKSIRKSEKKPLWTSVGASDVLFVLFCHKTADPDIIVTGRFTQIGTTLMADGTVRGSRHGTIYPNRVQPNGKDNRFSSRSGQIP